MGDIDILIQSSGTTGPRRQFHEIDDEGWAKTITIDLLDPMRLTQTFLPALRKGDWGRIVYLCSDDTVQQYDDELPY